MSEIQQASDAELARLAVLYKAIADHFTGKFNDTKALADKSFARGDRKAAVNGDVKLGLLYKTDPEVTATITNAPEFEAYLSVSCADKLERRVCLGDPNEIAPILMDAGHEPGEPGDLLWIEEVIPDWLKNEKLLEAKGGKKVPGVTVGRKDGSMTATVSKTARDIVSEHLDASPLDFLAIEGGQA